VSLLSTFVITGFKLLGRLPARSRTRKADRAVHCLTIFTRGIGVPLPWHFGLSVVAHLATITTFLFVAYAFRAPIAAVDFFASCRSSARSRSLPISFAGVGVREHILQVMLSNLTAVPAAVAVLIGSMSFFVMLVCAAPGGIVYLLYRPSGAKGAVSISDMEREVTSLDPGIVAKRAMPQPRSDEGRRSSSSRARRQAPVRRRDVCDDGRWQDHHARVFAGRFHFA
jgi:hypothetical protein